MHSLPSSEDVSGTRQPKQHRQHQGHGHRHISTTAPATTAAFRIVPLTSADLPLLESVEAASYPEHYCDGVAGFAKRLHARPACPSFVCLQGGDGTRGDVGARAMGYAITCRMPRRCASLLVRDADEKAAESSTDAAADNHHDRQCIADADIAALDPPADTLYIHDVAVHPDFRGVGVAGALWRKIEETRAALGLQRMALVAVFGASSYWSRHGFREVAREDLPPATVAVLEDYGDHAVFMESED